MIKTRRDVLQTIGDKFGGKYAERVSLVSKRRPPPDPMLDRTLSDEEFASEMKKLETEKSNVFWPDVKWVLLDELDDSDS
jgi:hypothetical protein